MLLVGHEELVLEPLAWKAPSQDCAALWTGLSRTCCRGLRPAPTTAPKGITIPHTHAHKLAPTWMTPPHHSTASTIVSRFRLKKRENMDVQFFNFLFLPFPLSFGLGAFQFLLLVGENSSLPYSFYVRLSFLGRKDICLHYGGNSVIWVFLT